MGSSICSRATVGVLISQSRGFDESVMLLEVISDHYPAPFDVYMNIVVKTYTQLRKKYLRPIKLFQVRINSAAN